MFPSTISFTINIRPVAKILVAATFTLLFSSWGKITDRHSLRYTAGAAAFRLATSRHVITLHGKHLSYQATAGYQPLNDAAGKPLANIFYTAYTLPTADHQKRPITFFFNGGPGSASIWLHIGAFGPVRVNEHGTTGDNPDSWLAFTDMVFIDPVGTGYSRAADGVDDRRFYGYGEDIASIAGFIKQYVAAHQLEDSPKFLAGESYGAIRAIGLADELEQNSAIKLAGITLISPALNYQLISFKPGNESAYSYYLPTYALAAQYHGRLSPALLKLSPEELIIRVTGFAQGSYQQFLNLGDAAPAALTRLVMDSLGYYTGLSPQYLRSLNGRITDDQFTSGLLRDSKITIGTFDSRLEDTTQNSDPSITAIRRLFIKAFNQYVSHDLNYQNKLPYMATAATAGWNYGPDANNSYMDATATLKKVMSRNHDLKISVAEGYYDLATPVGSTGYVLHHLELNRQLLNHITVNYYRAGHMIYTSDAANARFGKDSELFYSNTLRIIEKSKQL
jgi:carboxypeptidase C (cathepsin A)